MYCSQVLKNLTKINDCEFIIEFDEGQAIITIDSNIQLTIVDGDGNATVGTLVPPEPISEQGSYSEKTPFTFISDQKCDDIIIGDLDVKPTSISFKVNGQLQTFTEYVRDEDNAIIYLIKDSVIYTIEIIDDEKGIRYNIISINDCDCLWVLCCEFKLESGVYTSEVSMDVPALVVSYENCELCLSNPGLNPTAALSTNPISVVETADPCTFRVGPGLGPGLPKTFIITSETKFTIANILYNKKDSINIVPNTLNFYTEFNNTDPTNFTSISSSCSPLLVKVVTSNDGSFTRVEIFVEGELVITTIEAVDLTLLPSSYPAYIIQSGETFYVFWNNTIAGNYILAYIAQCNCFYINPNIR